MHPSAILSVDEVGERISEALKRLGWKVNLATYYPRDYMRYYATKRPGILEAFVIMQVIIRALEGNPNFVDLIFLFYADPNITGKGREKIPFGKKARVNDAEIFRKYCAEIFNLAGIKAEFDGWESETSPYSDKFNFKEKDPPQYEKAAYKITLYYIKYPIEKSVLHP